LIGKKGSFVRLGKRIPVEEMPKEKGGKGNACRQRTILFYIFRLERLRRVGEIRPSRFQGGVRSELCIVIKKRRRKKESQLMDVGGERGELQLI